MVWYTTGMYDFSAANNELGNPVRDLVQGTPNSATMVLSYLVLLLMEQTTP
jgi:hypothetical protein